MSTPPVSNTHFSSPINPTTLVVRKNYSSFLQTFIGVGLVLAAGTSGAIALKRISIQVIQLPTSALTGIAAGCSLIGLGLLFRSYQASQDRHARSLKTREQIDRFEKIGNFGEALEVARDAQKKEAHLGNQEGVDALQSVISDLEQKHLTFGSSRRLFDDQHNARPALLELLETLGMGKLNDKENDLSQIASWTRDKLICDGKEALDQIEKSWKDKSEIWTHLQQLGFIEDSGPHFVDYNMAIVHGHQSPSNLYSRLAYLVQLWKNGIQFTHLSFFCRNKKINYSWNQIEPNSTSPLKARIGWARFDKLPTTEQEMTQVIWDLIEIPEDMRKKLSVKFYDGSNHHPIPSLPKGRYLAISNGPYTYRNDWTLRQSMEGNALETVGPEADPKMPISTILDELGRLIFAIQ